jgi:ParB-like chromosome segregation protein Spo0J
MNKMGVKYVNVGTLQPNPKNPRHIEDAIAPVARSIEEFGFLVPIVINENNIVLSGHARLAAAKSLGMEKVPTVVAKGLTEDQETAFMLADNRLSDNASYNTEQLAGLLKELTGSDYDVLMTGFQPDEIEAFITSATSGLDDILGIGDDDDEDPVMGDVEDEKDVRHMHRLMFLLNAEQKSYIMEALDGVKKAFPGKLSNGEALASLCLQFGELKNDNESD